MNRDLVVVMTGRVLQMALMMLTLRIMTSRISPAEVANFSLLTSICTLFVWILVSPIGLYVNRHVLDWNASGTVWLNSAREAVYVIGIAGFTAAALFAWQAVFQPAWAAQFLWLGASIAFYIIFSVANQTVIPALNLFGKRISYTALFIATQILTLGASWYLAELYPSGQAWFFGQTIGFLLGFALALPWFLKASKPSRPVPAAFENIGAGIRDVAVFSLPISLAWGLTWVQFQSYRIVIGNLVSLEFLGLFFAGYAVSAGIMGAVEITAGQFFGPYFYKHVQAAESGREHDSWAAYMSTLYPLMIVIMIAIVVLAGPIGRLLLDGSFSGASRFIMLGAITEGIRVLAAAYALAAHVTKRTHVLLLPHAVGGASVVLTLLGGCLLLGEKAVVPAMIFSALVFLAIMHVVMRRHSGTGFAIQGRRSMAGASIALGGLLLLQSRLSPSAFSDIALLASGGVIIAGAFLSILRDGRNSLERFAR